MMPGGLPSSIQEMIKDKFEQAEEEKQLREQERQEASIAPIACDCSCTMAARNVQINSNCFQNCEQQYKLCDAPTYDQIKQFYDMSRQPTDQEEMEISKMRDALVSLLNEKESKRYVRESLEKQFDDSLWWMKSTVYENVVQRYAD
ncbi:MAG: hypothetical protein KTR16_16150 [Acidiferrobacterales bacterium]|nr:hypothetical protein [Acidiferrobacterales bacterium]